VSALRAELLKAVTTRLLLWFGLGLLAFLLLVLSRDSMSALYFSYVAWTCLRTSRNLTRRSSRITPSGEAV